MSPESHPSSGLPGQTAPGCQQNAASLTLTALSWVMISGWKGGSAWTMHTTPCVTSAGGEGRNRCGGFGAGCGCSRTHSRFDTQTIAAGGHTRKVLLLLVILPVPVLQFPLELKQKPKVATAVGVLSMVLGVLIAGCSRTSKTLSTNGCKRFAVQ